MITKTTLQHPKLLRKLVTAMRRAMANAKNRVSGMATVYNRKGQPFLYVIYSANLDRFVFTDCQPGKIARIPDVTGAVNAVFSASNSIGLQALARKVSA